MKKWFFLLGQAEYDGVEAHEQAVRPQGDRVQGAHQPLHPLLPLPAVILVLIMLLLLLLADPLQVKVDEVAISILKKEE